MASQARSGGQVSIRLLKLLIFLMFAMFAMTTDSVGTIIPEVIEAFGLGMTAAGSFHYATMSGIGLAAVLLGFLADRIGRKSTILLGLILFGVTSALFALGNSFGLFVIFLFVSGLGIGIFKSAALALIGEISTSTRDHARNMNLIEGFFGVGAIAGPAIVAWLLQEGASWKWLYIIAALLCAALIAGTAAAPFPKSAALQPEEDKADPRDVVRMMGDPFALFFAALLVLYVAAEAAIYVWAPTYFMGYDGPAAWLAAFSVSIFFVLRAAGRFLGALLLAQFHWAAVISFCSTAIALLFWVAIAGGREAAVFALPATGLFMSVMYPTINSTGISCYAKSRHGTIAGFLLFFTCIGAVIAPLIMGAVGDFTGNTDSAMTVGAIFATLLVGGCWWNSLRRPVERKLAERDGADYGTGELAESATRSLS